MKKMKREYMVLLVVDTQKGITDERLYGFKNIGFHKVQICVRPSNIKSKRVIEKCGFEYEGTLRDYFFIDGKYEGRMYYSLLVN